MAETLLVMRLADMKRVHPKQDNSRKCSNCGHVVGIFPSGQVLIRKHPNTIIICMQCIGSSDWNFAPVAPLEALIQEANESEDENGG
jgi:hypothetical protein